MLDYKELVTGNRYQCRANDIVTSWEVGLTWIGDGWSHDTQNYEGYYPPIVHEVTKEL